MVDAVARVEDSAAAAVAAFQSFAALAAAASWAPEVWTGRNSRAWGSCTAAGEQV